ncbi:RNA polymerase factor sigma-54 [Bradymonas sediminis]|uniref:RNA polymerase sigma-54 factor n=1 Tax=Bradymonas sediminis TaxID=1548548 RepID=A0A2Z4FRY9_9DELT|nr:RNA polymerase sigma-54 factor [Bradymonas sediminis]
MEMGLRAQLKQTQQLRMTPQLQQAIKLLQLSRLELIDAVQQEMNENPILEEARETYDGESLHAQEPDLQEIKKNDKLEEVRADERDMDKVDWDNYLNDYSSGAMPTNSYKGLSSSELPGIEQTLSTSESLVDHLMVQLRMLSLDPVREGVGALIIGNLDETGYLRNSTAADLAADADVDEALVEEVLGLIQQFDPLGVAARSAQECLLIQARELMPDDETVMAILNDHLLDLERKKINNITRALEVDDEEVIRAARLIAGLEPKPGRPFSQEAGRYITPDIYIVRNEDGELVCTLNDDGLPQLRVSNYYKSMLAQKKEDGEKDEVRDYIQDKLRGALWLIRSIEQRQSTIIKVTESIIKFQRDFFEKGVEYLRPLVLKEVADDIEMHESTISRVTTNKYVHTPRGVFELKYFFNSAITKTGGDDLASEAVKAKIRDIISGEDPKKPLSDAKIAQKLADEQNIDIARRTVAKYRESMGFLSSSKRKQVF